MNKKVVWCLIVLYRKDLIDSTAYITLLRNIKKFYSKNFDFNLVIWNNSPEIKLKKGEYKYYEGKNITLPVIYNFIAKRYLKSEDNFLMISDDDTDYSTYDFEKLVNLMDNNEKNGIFIPRLFANNKLVSPGRRFLFKGKYIESVDDGLIKSKNILGMNSGLIINYNCLNKMPFLFDKRLNFYGTDTDFFIRYENYFEYIYILPFSIEHDLSENNNDKERAIFRKKDNLYALEIIFGKTLFKRILFKIYCLYIKLKDFYETFK